MEQSIGNDKTMGGASVRLPGEAANLSLGDGATLRPDNAPLGCIDQYELLRELGGGGFGVVYLAHDTVAGIDVAVKGLPPLVRNNAEELERIRENFALVSKLHDRHIAAALVLHPAKEVSYADEKARQALRVMPGDTLMVMAYAPGVTLNKWRKQFPGGKVPVGQALEVCRQIAAALDYAHGEKVVHRDVKPSNVVVETRGSGWGGSEVHGSAVGGTPNAEVVVRVLDFGLAAEIRSSMNRVSQEKGDTSGTRPYMAPEQWAGKRQDGRTDQYALAALYYELVSGAVPFASAFDTGDPVIMANAAENKPPEPLAELNKAQNAALLRALTKEPAERFASCGEFVEALGGCHAETKRRGGRKALLWLAGAAVLCFGTYWSYTAYRSYATRLANERAAVEQAVKLDAAQREKVAELTAAVEAALDNGDLETAGAKIAALKGTGGPTSVSADLQKKYESKAGERETNRRYAAASVARENVQKLERGQGVGARLDALEVTWREAEAARQGQGWGQALSGYDAVLAECKRLGEEEISREGAKARKGEAEKAKEEGVRAEAAKDAKDVFEAGGRGSTRAAELFEKGSFAEAAKAWQEAAAYFASAKTRALAAQAYAKAKAAFEAALGGPISVSAVLLESHGGPKWADVKRLKKLGDAGASDPAAGADAYVKALAALPGAVEEARDAQQAKNVRMAAEAKAAEELKAREKAEAERVAVERQVVADKAQREKNKPDFESAMAAGKTAWDKADYPTAFHFYKKALQLWPRDPVAQTNVWRADALLTRLNPIRAAEKGDWWRVRRTFRDQEAESVSELFSTTDTEVLETTNDAVHYRETTRMLDTVNADPLSGREQSLGEYFQPRDVVGDFGKRITEKFVYEGRQLTDAEIGKNDEGWTPKNEAITVSGFETIRIGDQAYAAKCMVRSYTCSPIAYRDVVEKKYWIAEEAPYPLLKMASNTDFFDPSNNKLMKNINETIQCTGLGYEKMTISGEVMDCLKVTESRKTTTRIVKTISTETRSSTGSYVTWIPLKYPWLKYVKREELHMGGNGSLKDVCIVESFKTLRRTERLEGCVPYSTTGSKADKGDGDSGFVVVPVTGKMNPVKGEAWISPAVGMEFVWVPALELWVGKYEVTNGEYRKKDPSHDSKNYKGHALNEERQPAVYVNFDDAKAYAEWMTERDRDRLDGLHYRVISEQEWQTAAQCGDGREYPWGNAMPPKWGNYADSAAKRAFADWGTFIDGYTDGYAVTCPVEKSGTNEWGLYGLGGNVWECCASDASGLSFIAWRGASWSDRDSGVLECASRVDGGGSDRYHYLGFRLVLSR